MKAVLIALMVLVAAGVVSCASHSSSDGERRRSPIPDEVSLKSDRSEFDEARKDIPEDRRRENDELAMILQMVASKSNQEPGAIREKFSKAVRDRRERFDKIMRKRRDEFSKNEKRSRDDYMKKAKDDREHYLGAKHTPDERNRFFESQDDQRRDYFANEQDKRKDFESEMGEARKEFEDHVREKTDEFNDEMRTYTTEYYDRKKNEALQRDMKAKEPRSSGAASGQRDEHPSVGEDTIPPGPGIPLGAPSGKGH